MNDSSQSNSHWSINGYREASGGSQEATIRLILDRAYHRLRTISNQGRPVEGAERLLNLMRDLKVVPLDGVTIRIPLVYAEVWELKSRIKKYLKQKNKNFITMFASRSETDGLDPVGTALNQTLVKALNDYLFTHERYGLLLDLMRRHPVPSDPIINCTADHDLLLLQAETRGAFYPPNQGVSHPLFEGIEDKIPKLLLEVQTLIRIIFPLCADGSAESQKMGTIVLGLAFRNTDLRHTNRQLNPAVLAQVKQLGEVLINDIPRIYSYFEYKNVNPRAPNPLTEGDGADWQDEIHHEVDQLHIQVAALASRLRLDGWAKQKHVSPGYNFLIAFRSLDPKTLEGRLQYCLSSLNKKALATNLESGVFLQSAHYEKIFNATKGLFDPFDPSKDEAERQRFITRGRELMEGILVNQPKETALKNLIEAIEHNHYPVNLTPGYHVMTLGYPEIVKDWLRDPRAKGFQTYPPLLLSWEGAAIPAETELYYSPLAEGSIRFGICGVKTDLLYSDGGLELQQLIDSRSHDLREIICNDHITKLKNALNRARWDGIAGGSLWKEALWHFRQLAYYFLPQMDDYFTMIIEKSEAEELDQIILRSNAKWSGDEKPYWQELHGGLSNEAIAYIVSVDAQRPRAKDGIDSCLVSYFKKHRRQGDGQLYQVRLPSAPTARLLVLVPERRYRQRTASLLSRFSTACESALGSYRNETVSFINAMDLGHQCVYLMHLVRSGLTRTTEHMDHVRLLIEVLQNEMNYFTDRIDEIKNGKPITLEQLFQLMIEITSTIRWAKKRARVPLKGHLEGVSRPNLNTLDLALSSASRGEAFKAMKKHSLGISRSAALLLMWETAFNLAKHSGAKITFSVSSSERNQVNLEIESGSATTVVTKSGRYGVRHLQKVASELGVGFDSHRLDDDHFIFHASMIFPARQPT